MTRYFEPGETVVRRDRKDAYRWAAPLRVIEDGPDLTVLYLPIGVSYRRMGGADGNPTREFATATRLIESTWADNNALHLMRPGDGHATILFWNEAGKFLCYYINFQEPYRRFELGFDSMDQTLDLLISPDGQRHQWKDEDEFESGIAHGWYTAELKAGLYASGERIIAEAKAGAWPFRAGWDAWRPDASWPLPVLPPNWDD